MKASYLFVGLLTLGMVTGCQDGLVSTSAESSDSAGSSAVLSKNGAQLGGMIWADGELFKTVGTPTAFHPGQGPFDKLFQGPFKDGIGAISESKPGDKDWNGGRWDVYHIKEGVMTDYSNATSVEDLNLSDFESIGVYLECPLIPMRGQGH